jgi:hypothetical protein
MWRSSASEMPMWRGMNSLGFSSSPSGRADCISIVDFSMANDLAAARLDDE